MSQRSHVCIHGHWYQPPRENPFTGIVGNQPSAAPFDNWNERITAECYEPNAAAQILGDDGSVRRLVNNYEYVSSDWGPTLLAWLEKHHPDTYQAVVAADRISRQRLGGHGTAIAHTYNHTILPLSNRRDKRTQILWGKADFVHRFGHPPGGMWLPETAVDLETLELLADAAIQYTILAPHQAASVLEHGEWREVLDGTIDTTIPYEVQLFGGRRIAIFFYNGPLSREIAFDGLLEDGTLLARRLAEPLAGSSDRPRLSHVATDGETYGHHHRHGEMALARAIEDLEANPEVELTTYGRFLAQSPPTDVARIVEDTSWSCAHGVGRWERDCGCSAGRHPEWAQTWRAPLRAAFDLLRDELIDDFESRGATVLIDPWLARDHYIEVILGRPIESFLDEHGRPGTSADQRRLAGELLEIQHRAMLMYTSCGWFFDDIAGLESVFVLRQAGRVIDLARKALGKDLEPGFLEVLETARSNVEGRNGRDVYVEWVIPHMSAGSPATG